MNFQILFDIMKQTSHFHSSYFENIYLNAFCELIREGYPVFFGDEDCVVSDSSYMYTASKKQLSSMIDLERYEKISNMLNLDKNEFIPEYDGIDEYEEEIEEIEELDEDENLEEEHELVLKNVEDESIEDGFVEQEIEEPLYEEEYEDEVLVDASDTEEDVAEIDDDSDIIVEDENDKIDDKPVEHTEQEGVIVKPPVSSENAEKETVKKDETTTSKPKQNISPASDSASAKVNSMPNVDPLAILSGLYSGNNAQKENTLKELQEGVDYLGAPPEDVNSKQEESVADNNVSNNAKDSTHSNNTGDEKKSNSKKEVSNGVKNLPNGVKIFDDSYEFPSFMNKKDFTFFYDHIIVTTPSGEEEEAEFIVAPLSLIEGDKRIVVWVNMGDEIFVDMSRLRKTVLVHLETCDIIAGGEISNGEFVPFISLTRKEITSGFTLQEDKVLNGGHGGHVALEDNGIKIHIFPVAFNNNDSGDADYFYVLHEDDEYITGDTSKAPATFVFNKVECKAVARWEENKGVLYAAVLPK